MDSEFSILIADRNRHVRELLRRELTAEGYRVQTAKDGREVLVAVDGDSPPDLLVLDLDLPYVEGLNIMERLQNRTPPLPVVVHTFLTENTGELIAEQSAAFVEKSGDTDILKAAIEDMLQRFYPDRCSNRPERAQEKRDDDGIE
jgi:DNA-binding response OmpR family regulator